MSLKERATMERTAAATTPDSSSTDSHSPRRFCDLVMKGGITSGIVYPKAVCELAKSYTFRNIGGTSAGAIAAAATAAAELGRHRGRNSFDELAKLPTQLGNDSPSGKGSFLFTLFQPQPQFARIYGVLTGLLGARRPLLALPARLARAYWLVTLLSLGVGAAFWFALMPGADPLLALPRAFAAAIMLLLTFLLGIAWSVHRELSGLSSRMLGLCTGMPNPKVGGDALIPWLSDLLDRYAGQPSDTPLTFGDLWDSEDPSTYKRINLEMMTTSLTHGRPYRLPFDERVFYFKESEFRSLFPKHVVDWMVANPRPSKNPFEGFVPLPVAANLPVIVATRMSLSFPVLFCAVPLYAVDRGRKDQPPQPEICWFSDGGICSNFPVHFFDSPLPRWPTFAINLMEWDRTRVDPTEGKPSCKQQQAKAMVRAADTNNALLSELWNRFELDPDGNRKSGLGPVKGMASAIMKSMQNWVDNRQMRVPGYRDRIAHVVLCPDEGGMNLSMPTEVIQRVSDRGGDAGRLLIDRFHP
ncbi:MAG: patatin-like phospholipase family protein, partial [Bryobacterales bacterium]|nr:patatin-like phospholipase family protein [Bryobacterales bacterium]